MSGTTIYEFDALVAIAPGISDAIGLRSVPPHVFAWLESQALSVAEAGETAWLRLSQRRGRRAVQVASFVGVIRAPDGYQIEVLPKVAKAIGGGDGEARELLIQMLRCLGGFRHIQTDSANLVATRMPLLEVFIGEFLRAVEHIVKRGLRSDYNPRQDNLFALRGKLQMATHLRRNLCHRDRFFAEFDEFSPDRPENRLLHSALRRALDWTGSQTHQQLARELCFVFAEVPASQHPLTDFQRVRLDRGMAHYDGALAWARLILEVESPLTGAGSHRAPSLMFPMEAVFEAFVAKHLARQFGQGLTLRTQARNLSLVRHLGKDWFRLKPDLLVQTSKVNRLVLDTKWKLIDGQQATGSDKYGLDQGDFYQLNAYGQNYLDGEGDVVLIYPKTHSFNKALPVFEFPKSSGLRLWVLPFCLRDKRLLLPPSGELDAYFAPPTPLDSAHHDVADILRSRNQSAIN
ncbi:McrC family protein [Paraburkholderia bannensis]|uniref:McrC family protein n=1 Tax=Paraburkholderia bannensis TaxID=765414 RepID=UPI002AB768FF|nr:McrC family protein [Paraburkholderia bannensis]